MLSIDVELLQTQKLLPAPKGVERYFERLLLGVTRGVSTEPEADTVHSHRVKTSNEREGRGSLLVAILVARREEVVQVHRVHRDSDRRNGRVVEYEFVRSTDLGFGSSRWEDQQKDPERQNPRIRDRAA